MLVRLSVISYLESYAISSILGHFDATRHPLENVSDIQHPIPEPLKLLLAIRSTGRCFIKKPLIDSSQDIALLPSLPREHGLNIVDPFNAFVACAPSQSRGI